MKRFKPQNSYLFMTENISYLAKKSFSTKMIKCSPNSKTLRTEKFDKVKGLPTIDKDLFLQVAIFDIEELNHVKNDVLRTGYGESRYPLRFDFDEEDSYVVRAYLRENKSATKNKNSVEQQATGNVQVYRDLNLVTNTDDFHRLNKLILVMTFAYEVIASISSIVFGAFSVMFTGPSLVQIISSSILTPIPRSSLGISCLIVFALLISSFSRIVAFSIPSSFLLSLIFLVIDASLSNNVNFFGNLYVQIIIIILRYNKHSAALHDS